MTRTHLSSLLLATALCGCSFGMGYKDAQTSVSNESYGEIATDATFEDTDIADTDFDTAIIEDCDEISDVTLYISPDDSNSRSSPVQARDRVLNNGNLDWAALRTYEFMNYYSFDYPSAEPGELNIDASLIAADAELGRYKLQIGVSSAAVSNEDRLPMNITLVMDTSGSMEGAPIELLRESGLAIASSLKEGDIVSMVTWSSDDEVNLDSLAVLGPYDITLLSAINSLASGGGTNLSGGLQTGYALAEKNFSADRINRIVLISDGGANMGQTDETIIGSHADENDGEGIYLIGVGTGTPSTYNDLLMDTVTDIGKGASVFVSSKEEAHRVFGPDRFVNTMSVAERDVQVQLDLPPGFDIVKFSGEEYSTRRADIEPQHIAPNDSMVFFQTIETCAPEAITSDSQVTVRVSYLDAITFEPKTTVMQTTIGALLDEDPALLYKGQAIFEYAEGLAEYRDEADIIALSEAIDALETAEEANPGDADLAEIRSVLTALID